ncbi:MAG: tetratricopeptide repeat protein [Bacteroidia bacterium]
MSITKAEFKQQLTLIKDESEKIKAIQNYVWPAMESFPNTLVLKENYDLLTEAFQIAQQINDRWGLAYGYINKAFWELHITQHPQAFDYFNTGLAILNELEDKWAYGRALNSMSYSLATMGRYDEALKYGFISLKFAEETQMIEPMGWANYALGVFYFDMKDYVAAENYYKKAFDIFSKDEKFVLPCARCRSGIGSVMIVTNRLDEALEYVNLSIEGYRKSGNLMGESRGLNDLGIILRDKLQYVEAEKYLNESLLMREKSNYYQGIITSCLELGTLYLKTNNLKKAEDYLNRGLTLAYDIKSKPKLFLIHDMLGELYKKTNEFEKALKHKEIYFEIKTEVTGEHAANRVKYMQTQFAIEKSETESEIHRLKNVQLKKAYEQIEEKNKNILDSINYAKRIQQAILPSDNEVKKILPNSFVLYMPKDVVSGDFYWVQKKDNNILFAAIDCTGHGVPGAFMSMIGNTLLNEIVNDRGVIKPSEILEHLREGIIKALKQTGEAGENQDGMDIAICALNEQKQQLQFAGANNPLWIVSNNILTEIKADKQPIGIYYGNAKPFTNHIVNLNKGDVVYIFTDGYADQIGGDLQKKFKYKQLQQLIETHFKSDMQLQQKIYHQAINNWKGELEQIDDILLMGIRI